MTPLIRFSGFTEAWEQRKIGDRMFIKSRIGWQQLTKDEYLDFGDYYLITGTDITQNHRIDYKTCHFVSKRRYEMDLNIQLRNGDIVLTKDGTIGKVAIIDSLDKPATLNSHLFLLRNQDRLLDSHFLFHILDSHLFSRFVENTETGSTLTGLPQKTFLQFSYLAPSLAEQRKVSGLIDECDAVIVLHQRKLDQLKALKKSLLQKMFPADGEDTPRIRFAGFTEAWEQRKLGEIGVVIDPHPSHRAPKEVKGGIPFIGIGDVDESGNINRDSARPVDPSVFEEHHRRYDLSIPSLGLGRVASLGKVIKLRNDIGKYAVSPTMSVLQFKTGFDVEYLYAFMNSPQFQKQFDGKSNGSTRQSVGTETVRILDIFLPKELAEQTLLGDFFAELGSSIVLQQSKLDKLKDLKKSLLQQMFI